MTVKRKRAGVRSQIHLAVKEIKKQTEKIEQLLKKLTEAKK